MHTLADALPGAPFRESHSRIVDAPPSRVWDALMTLRWTDLTLTKALVLVRFAGLVPARPAPIVEHGPVVAVAVDHGVRWVGVRIGRPWRLLPTLAPDPATLEDLARFDRPGWLKFGMEFVLEPLDAARTAVTTSTLCVATDARAHRRFARYWRLIRPFSGLIRLDMLAALARVCESEAVPVS